MGHDGVLTLYGPSNKIHWEIFGGVCDKTSRGDCVNGAVMRDDGYLEIGGRPVARVFMTRGGEALLSPWPFAEAPTLRVRK
jgi:hypothetical protein